MATLYFSWTEANAATFDNNWATLSNWWSDAALTIPAAALPTSTDSVHIAEGIYISANSGPAPTVVNLYVAAVANISIDLTVTGLATFDDGALEGTATLTGDAEFLGEALLGAYSASGTTIEGNATFHSATNGSIVTGNAVFSGSGYNYGDVQQDAAFYDTTFNNTTVAGDALFEDDSYNDYFALVYGNATFRGNSHNRHGCDYNSSVVANRGQGIRGSNILGVT
jgi:hypothetical protein